MAKDHQRPNILPPFFPLKPPPPPPLHSNTSADASFPILAISIVGMLTTAILLLSYYVFVIKCCLRSDDVLRRISRSHRRAIQSRLRSSPYSPSPEPGGLDESAIRSIPTLRFFRSNGHPFRECAVCLNEFQEEEKLRILPSCRHVFHVDCIDTWLQTHSSCPLCRADITPHYTFPMIQLSHDPPPEPSRSETKKKTVRSMGDECIDIRLKDKELFGALQPMRRSFSVDSSGDRQLYVAVQEILRQNPHFRAVEGSTSSASGRNRKSFFSFGRASKSGAVLPIQITDTDTPNVESGSIV